MDPKFCLIFLLMTHPLALADTKALQEAAERTDLISKKKGRVNGIDVTLYKYVDDIPPEKVDLTIQLCRGLILTDEATPVNAPMPKFENLVEGQADMHAYHAAVDEMISNKFEQSVLARKSWTEHAFTPLYITGSFL